MIRNYFLTALRSFRRRPVYATVNVVGLALGMAACVLILTVVHFEWRFDRYHEQADRIYKINLRYVAPDGAPGYQLMMTPDFTPDFKETFPAVSRATRLVQNSVDIRVGGEIFRSMTAEVDPDFFGMFTAPLVEGSARQVLQSPDDMVISRSIAESWFGSTAAAMGEVATISRGDVNRDFTVAGVFEDFPAWSSIAFDVAISFENYDEIQLGGNNWGGRTSTYALLADGTDAKSFEAGLGPFTATAFAEYIDAMRGAGYMALHEDAFAIELQPLTSVHRSPEVGVRYERAVHNPLYSWILAGIGLLILLIACINFMTLSVGQAATRAHEVGIRKALGANRSQLMKQYLGESMALATVALAAGLPLAVLAQPWFNNLTGRDLSILGLSPAFLAAGLVILLAIVGVVAGGYPAAVLSRFQPARVLKGDTPLVGGGLLMRSLVVAQFTISIGLLSSLFIMSDQMDHLLTADMGYDADRVLAIEARGLDADRAEDIVNAFRQAAQPSPYVERVARAGQAFTRSSDRNGWQDADGIQRSAYNFGVDYDYVDVMGMKIVSGRNFSRDFPADPTHSILVNEALVREFGLTDPVGHVMDGWLDWIYDTPPTIIGVVEDFNFQSLHTAVEPAVMNMHPNYYNRLGAILVRIAPTRTALALRALEDAWAQVAPGAPYQWAFVSDDMARQYASEQQWQAIVRWSSVLAVIIAAMGLFGLALLSVTRRLKEIGIRKVLGADTPQIVRLVTGEFAILVALAAAIAVPLAWLAMDRWLDNFAYRIQMGASSFALAALIALGVALTTVAWHALGAARTDPARTLRQ